MEMARSGGAGLPGNRRQVAVGVGFRNCLEGTKTLFQTFGSTISINDVWISMRSILFDFM